MHRFINPRKTYLYEDVGGGSTEFSIIHNSEKIKSKSFRIGTVRLLIDSVKNENWRKLEHWIKTASNVCYKIELIGSGGNINKIFKISGKDIGKPLSYFYLTTNYNDLQKYTY